jgi:hypothetical protein
MRVMIVAIATLNRILIDIYNNYTSLINQSKKRCKATSTQPFITSWQNMKNLNHQPLRKFSL